MGAEQYRADIEADAWRFYRLWLDIEAGVFPDLDSGRLFEMLERLPLYEGALTARANAENRRHGTGDNGYGPVGVEEIGSSGAELISHPALAGLIEYKQV